MKKRINFFSISYVLCSLFYTYLYKLFKIKMTQMSEMSEITRLYYLHSPRLIRGFCLHLPRILCSIPRPPLERLILLYPSPLLILLHPTPLRPYHQIPSSPFLHAHLLSILRSHLLPTHVHQAGMYNVPRPPLSIFLWHAPGVRYLVDA